MSLHHRSSGGGAVSDRLGAATAAASAQEKGTGAENGKSNFFHEAEFSTYFVTNKFNYLHLNQLWKPLTKILRSKSTEKVVPALHQHRACKLGAAAENSVVQGNVLTGVLGHHVGQARGVAALNGADIDAPLLQALTEQTQRAAVQKTRGLEPQSGNFTLRPATASPAPPSAQP